MPLDTGRIWPIVTAWPAHWRATVVHLEGTQTIGDSTATPHRRPALDREGPSTVLLALRFPGVVARVYPLLTSGHVQVAADHQVLGGNWSH